MTPLDLGLIVVGIVLVVLGVSRARGPWARYQDLRARDENVARYEAWRGGARDRSTTGTSVAMALLRRQAQAGAIVALAGIVAIILGLVLR